MTKTAVSIFTQWLDQYLNFEKTPKKNIFWLDTMEYLCRRFNHPEKSCDTFHVAGSKGKGSISMMISSILTEAGFYTGLYTSPHILEFTERVGTPRGRFPEEIYERSVSEIINGVQSIIPEDLPGERPLTWFELVTLFGMLCFRNAKTDCAVYEVGIGGRLDATNVISPKACCISVIEKEHTEYLGNTIEEIAGEKGGIIKEGIPVIIAKQSREVRNVFEGIALNQKAPVYFIEDCLKSYKYVYKSAQLNGDDAYSSDYGMEITLALDGFSRPLHTVLKMFGEFQVYNASIAALAVKKVYPQISEETIEKGLSKAFLPGRFEVIRNICSYPDIPEIIFDGAHTVNSIRYTLQTFDRLYALKTQHARANLLFACAADKDVEDMCVMFRDKFSRIMITKPGGVKESDLERMEKAFTDSRIEHESCFDYIRAIENSLYAANEAKVPLLVTGSFYLVSEVKKFLLGKKCIQSV